MFKARPKAVGARPKDIKARPVVSPDLMHFAVDITRQAGELTLNWYQHATLAVDAKHDGSPITPADLAVERLMRQLIADRYPDDAILGEELDDTSGNGNRTWVIDPIDGTKAFVAGVPLYATLLAVVDEHGPAVGVIFLPALDECVWAGRGHGARWNGKPCQVSDRQQLRDSVLCTSGLSYWPDAALSQIRDTGARVRTWGDAYGYALVATGRAEAMVDPQCSDWDVAPMAVIIPEAGGQFSDTSGVKSWQRGAAVGSNGTVHEEVLTCFSKQ